MRDESQRSEARGRKSEAGMRAAGFRAISCVSWFLSLRSRVPRGCVAPCPHCDSYVAISIRFYLIPMHFLCRFYAVSMRYLYRLLLNRMPFAAGKAWYCRQKILAMRLEPTEKDRKMDDRKMPASRRTRPYPWPISCDGRGEFGQESQATDETRSKHGLLPHFSRGSVRPLCSLCVFVAVNLAESAARVRNRRAVPKLSQSNSKQFPSVPKHSQTPPSSFQMIPKRSQSFL